MNDGTVGEYCLVPVAKPHTFGGTGQPLAKPLSESTIQRVLFAAEYVNGYQQRAASAQRVTDTVPRTAAEACRVPQAVTSAHGLTHRSGFTRANRIGSNGYFLTARACLCHTGVLESAEPQRDPPACLPG